MHKTILIVPYRDREKHLDYFLSKSYPKINDLIQNLEIIIVEQAAGNNFNRGATINIGYLHYNDPNNYYITQDVDTNPNKISLPYYAQELKDDEFLSIYSYVSTVGGIAKFKGSDFVKVNGFPNDFWGWGNEDADFMNRIYHYNCNVTRVFSTDQAHWQSHFSNDKFDILLDEHIRKPCLKDDHVNKNWLSMSFQKREEYILNNGLSTIKYDVLNKESLMENVNKITVEIY